MRTRQADCEINWNGAAVTSQMLGSKTTVTYTDVASGEADSLDIEINDCRRQWIIAWLPMLGDSLTAKIKLTDWQQEGDNRQLDCGLFLLDDFAFSGWPVIGKISAVSTPANTAFRETQRSKNWEQVTIREIAREIAGRVGIKLLWEVQGNDFIIGSIEQNKQTDCDFLMSLCDTYGLSLKIYANQLVIFDREAYKEKAAALTISEEDIISWSWQKTLAGTYTGGELNYTDQLSGKEITAKVGSGPRLLKVSARAENQGDAERRIKAAVNTANHGATSLRITIMGNACLAAGQCVTVVGLGRLSGKYYINRITHHIGGGYTMDMELSLAALLTKEVIEDAINRLAALGIIDSPSYWLASYQEVLYLDGLLLNMATHIKANKGGSISTAEQAIAKLSAAGVLNSPDYWRAKIGSLNNLALLLIKAANALG